MLERIGYAQQKLALFFVLVYLEIQPCLSGYPKKNPNKQIKKHLKNQNQTANSWNSSSRDSLKHTAVVQTGTV